MRSPIGGDIYQSGIVTQADLQPKPLPTKSFGDPATFTGAANQQASDYDKIMSQYDDLIKNYSTNPLIAQHIDAAQTGNPGNVSNTDVSFRQVTPQTSQYSQSDDVTNSLSTLSNLAATGGYSEQDKQDIRARDISPIRSIYANAQQNAERAKALSGGYSPNFNATTAQMSRDEANKIGDITTAANAGIAQNVASNRIAAASPYASASATANAARTEADRHNADIINQANQFNSLGSLDANKFNASGALDASKFNTDNAFKVAEGNANRLTSTRQFNSQAELNAAMANRGNMLGAIQGKTSLYGTTPALTSLFGSQVVQAGQLGLNQQQVNNQKQNDQWSQIYKGAQI